MSDNDKNIGFLLVCIGVVVLLTAYAIVQGVRLDQEAKFRRECAAKGWSLQVKNDHPVCVDPATDPS